MSVRVDHKDWENERQFRTIQEIVRILERSQGDAGTYTPIATVVANVTGTPTVPSAQFLRFGNVVLVSGSISIQPTAAAGADVQVDLSLPITSNFTSSVHLRGVVGNHNINQSGAVFGNEIDKKARIQYNAVDTTNRSISYIYLYRIIE